jgi:CBS domain containing-hemolysin-like protein
VTEFLILVFLLLGALDLLVIASRAAFSHVVHARLLVLREQMGNQVSKTINLLPRLPRLRASLGLSLIILRFSLAGVVGFYVYLRSAAYPVLVGTAALLVSAVFLFWLEWAVERAVTRAPEIWAVRLTSFIRVLMALVSVLLVPLAFSGEKQSSLEASTVVSEDELKTLVDAGQEGGVFELGERRMIYSIFQLGDTLAREIMVPRIDMFALDVLTPLPDAVDALLKTGHSRVPVFDETIDQTLGLLYSKDLLRIWREGDRSMSLGDLLRPAHFVPEAKKVDELLAEMQSRRIHMAIVVDEYGGVAGLVTLEDIVEEIVGEILDEYDQAEEAPYQKLPDGSYVFQGRVNLDDFNEIMECDLPSDEADTLGGYIYSRLGRAPAIGEAVYKDNLVLTVEQVSARRIRKVSARWLLPEDPNKPPTSPGKNTYMQAENGIAQVDEVRDKDENSVDG